MSCLCSSVSGRARRGDSYAAWPLEFCPGGSYLSVLTLHFLPIYFPYMSLVPFQMLPWCCIPERAGWVYVSPKSVAGPLRGVSSTAPAPAGFHSQKLWEFIFWCWKPGLGGLDWGWAPSLPRYPSWFLSTTCGCGPASSSPWASPYHSASPCLSTSPHLSVPLRASLRLLPSYPFGWMWLLYILGCWTSTQLDFLTILGDICFVV